MRLVEILGCMSSYLWPQNDVLYDCGVAGSTDCHILPCCIAGKMSLHLRQFSGQMSNWRRGRRLRAMPTSRQTMPQPQGLLTVPWSKR